MDRTHARIPSHARDCLAGWHGNEKAPCRCPRGKWLDEPVPRWQARAELLEDLQAWAREQRILTDGDLDAMRTYRVHGSAGGVDESIPRMALEGIRAAQSIGREIWGRIAVGALSQLQDMERRRPPVPARQATRLRGASPAIFALPPVEGVVTIAAAGDVL